MRTKYLLPLALGSVVAIAAIGQAMLGAQSKGVAGKWGTDAAIAKAANPAAPAGGNAVMLDIKVDTSNKVTGSIVEYGNALCGSPDTNLPIDSGTVDAKVVTFVTTRPNANSCPVAGAAPGPVTGTQVTWTGTLGDDDALSVTRAIGGGGRGGGGGGRGAGAGAPPAGGAPPAAAGAAPAGAPPAGGPPAGAPAGGGGGGRGGGGRGGGGALAMHRIP